MDVYAGIYRGVVAVDRCGVKEVDLGAVRLAATATLGEGIYRPGLFIPDLGVCIPDPDGNTICGIYRPGELTPDPGATGIYFPTGDAGSDGIYFG